MTVDEIYSQMAQTFQTETGLALAGDGDMAVRLYAVAAQIYALYVQIATLCCIEVIFQYLN